MCHLNPATGCTENDSMLKNMGTLNQYNGNIIGHFLLFCQLKTGIRSASFCPNTEEIMVSVSQIIIIMDFFYLLPPPAPLLAHQLNTQTTLMKLSTKFFLMIYCDNNKVW